MPRFVVYISSQGLVETILVSPITPAPTRNPPTNPEAPRCSRGRRPRAGRASQDGRGLDRATGQPGERPTPSVVAPPLRRPDSRVHVPPGAANALPCGKSRSCLLLPLNPVPHSIGLERKHESHRQLACRGDETGPEIIEDLAFQHPDVHGIGQMLQLSEPME